MNEQYDMRERILTVELLLDGTLFVTIRDHS